MRYKRNLLNTEGAKNLQTIWHLLRQKKVSKEILFLVFFFLVVGQVFHPEGVDSSLFAAIYLSMIFICLRVCFIILFTCVPLSVPHSSPTNVTHGCICSMFLSICLSLCMCPTTVKLTLSSPACTISPFIHSGFFPLKPRQVRLVRQIILHLFLLSSPLVLQLICGPLSLKADGYYNVHVRLHSPLEALM